MTSERHETYADLNIKHVRTAFPDQDRACEMSNSYTPKERTSDAIKSGFDSDPTAKKVEKGEVLIVYRAHDGKNVGSRMIGNFYFVPHNNNVPSVNWTAEMLERELNAALWGNTFEYLSKFQVFEGTPYKIGPIAHDRYQGEEYRKDDAGSTSTVPFDQYSYFRNANLFLQVQIAVGSNWREHLKLLSDEPIKPGRFHKGSNKWM